MSESWLLWAFVFGTIGLAYFVYGRKRPALVPLVCGLSLMVFPYFVTKIVLLVAIGAVLVVLPYFIRL